MYTHIGNNLILKNKDIIGIFDKKTIDSSRENKRIQFQMKDIKENIKSVILLQEEDRYVEIYSQISTSTLKKRIEKGII